ncbi:MAG: chitobiase/beta-hexosaminidase C-terminal domain-containing protein [Kiritimatiellae bacterium]|nr:chitobiase/beta-hexosaminidase C-terminal domain-containing protein [Kiritimatiellia bacterium]
MAILRAANGIAPARPAFRVGIWLVLAVGAAGPSCAATFKTVGGEVVIEAEDYTRLGGSLGGAWYLNTARAGHLGTGYVQSTTDDPSTLSFSADNSRVEYDIDFQETGTYYLFLRTSSDDETQNGFFATLNGSHFTLEHVYGPDTPFYVWVSQITPNWTWYTDAGGAGARGNRVWCTITTPGVHTVAIHRRDKSTRLDRIWLSKNQTTMLPVQTPPTTTDAAMTDPSVFLTSGGSGTTLTLNALGFPYAGTFFYSNTTWLAIDPENTVANPSRSASVSKAFPGPSGTYAITLYGVGENDGRSLYRLSVGGAQVGEFLCPLSSLGMEEGAAYNTTWPDIPVAAGATITLWAQCGTVDNVEWSRGRWSKLVFSSGGGGTGAFVEQDGLVVMEVESIPSTEDWVQETENAGYSGAGYYRWNGPDHFDDPTHGVLEYPVRIVNAGTYHFRWHNRHDHPTDPTEWNDTWVSMDDGVPVKCFQGNNNVWNWVCAFEPSFGVFEYDPQFTLTAGYHTLRIAGRSYGHKIDRIHLYRDGVTDPTGLSHPESPREDDGSSPPAAPSNLAVLPVSSTRLDVTWTDNSSYEESFTLQWWTSGAATQSVQVAANAVLYGHTGLTPDTAYSYRVRANHSTLGHSSYTDPVSAKTPATDSPTATLAFGPTDDAYLQNGTLYNNTELRVENNTATPRVRTTYLKFNVSGLNDGAVQSATLKIRNTDSVARSGTYSLSLGSHTNWTETTLTDAGKPAPVQLLATQSGAMPVGTVFEWDVSAGIAGDGVYTLILHMDADAGNDLAFSSRTGAQAPELEVTVEVSSGNLFVARASDWRYLKGTREASAPRDEWRRLDFDDTGWSAGQAPFGYGNAGLNTPFADMQGSYSSFFLRKAFTVETLGPDLRLSAAVDYDDGFVMWINGERVLDKNEPDGEPLFDSLAAEPRSAGTFSSYELPDPAAYLEPGPNVVAVQVFNVARDSAGAKFDLELSTFQRVADTTFSADRGFYDTAFAVTVATATAGASIRYTTDGSLPTESAGTFGGVGTAVIPIAGTTCLRAAAFKGGYHPTDVDTQTYIFLDDAIAQPHRPSGFPSSWVCTDGSLPTAQRTLSADYQMDPAIVDPAPAAMREALLDIPTLSVVLRREDMFGSLGIYHNYEGDKTGSERAASLELIHPDGSAGFQIDCALRPHSHARWKRSFKVLFKGEYGPGTLDHDVFAGAPQNADSATTVFDKLVLRAGNNDSWHAWDVGTNLTTYTRDQFVRDSQIAIAGFGCRGDYMHLYLNGLYWGLYNVAERTDESWEAAYLGGEKDDWFAINHGGDITETAGSDDRWDSMLSYAKAYTLADAGHYAQFAQRLDVPEFADYIALLSYCGAGDWPANNWYAGNRNTPPGPAMFYVWDAEDCFIFKDGRSNDGAWLHPDLDAVTNAWGNVPIAIAWSALTNNADFRLLFADRVYAHAFNGGPLAEPNTHARFESINARVAKSIRAESARWGDGERWPPGTPDGYTCTVQDWIDATNAFHNNLIGNPARFVSVLRAANPPLYPSIDPPGFHRQGGSIAAGFSLTMSNPNAGGAIYYTADGADPRAAGGAVAAGAAPYTSPVSLSRTTHLRARVCKSAATWSAVRAATFNFTAHYSRIRITEIMYNPLGGGEFEFVEVKNTGTSTRGLSEMRFAGIRYAFEPGTDLPAGGIALLVRNEAAFTNRYPAVKGAVAVFGVYDGGLDNGGERLALLDSDGLTVTAVRYNDKDPWPEAADGDGHSLVVIDANGDPQDPANWRASNLIGGSPGYDDGAPYRVVVCEALTHTDLPQKDTIELYNAGSAAADLGGWYLSDSALEYRKYPIPAGTTLAAGGYVLFDEDDFNTPTNDPSSFALSSHGDEIYLTRFDAAGNLQYLAEAQFGGSANGVAFGRWLCSDGGADFVAQSGSNTLGAATAYPRVGPVVINELMYHPAPGADEFIELLNISAATVKLYDPAVPTNTWKFAGGVEYVFPAGTELAPGEYALAVATNPAAFRSAYAIPSAVRIFGPYAGVLDNGGESVRLWRPDTPDAEGVPWILVDRVAYNDNSPWPENADGGGYSIERQAASRYGNDPANWASSLSPGGTPGAANSGGLVSRSAGWKYHDRGLDLGTSWRAPGFDDSAWRDGNGPLGYADAGAYPALDTALDYGDDPADKPITTYFRKRFTLDAEPGNVTNLVLYATYDDGFAAYLNGQEVARAGLAGTIAYGTTATSHDATDYEPFNLLAHTAKLVRGENVLAVEVHQSGPASSDLFWDAELAGAASVLPSVAAPTFSPNGGLFSGSVAVTIACTTDGATIFYRTDQADPSDQSYHGAGLSPQAFTLSDSATVRARAYKAGMAASGIAEATFTEDLPAVATPTISPPGGDFYGSVSVTLACATAGATIFYRTDQTDPTDQSFHGAGTSPCVFSLSASATVKARACRADHTPSAVAGATFTDLTPTVQFAAATSSGSESSSPANLAVVLSGASPHTVTVDFDAAGGTAEGGGTDYTLAAGILTFAAGQTNQTISVTIVDDDTEESAETIVLSLSSPANALLGSPAAHTYTIADNDSLWTAYNDLCWSNGQTAVRITTYGQGEAGLLVDYATGTPTPATLTVGGGGGPRPTQGAAAGAGTDGYGVFHGIVDCLGLVNYGDNLTLHFAGLDPTLRYEVVVFGNRDEAGYTDRLTTTAISDADAFRNASTSSQTYDGPADASTTICNGYNTANGFVARFEAIAPGADGDFLITVSDSDSRFYANALMLRAQAADTSVLSVDGRVGAGEDDVEEYEDGTMDLSSSDLELVYDAGKGNQTVGLRFTGLNIPPNSTVRSAYIQFEADETASAAGSLLVRAEAADDAAAFTTNGYDLSSRALTAVSAAWSPAPWNTIGEAGAAQRTPDLSAVLQQVLGRTGWQAGNAVVLVVTGTGTRTACAVEGKPAGAALLHVEYTAQAAPSTVIPGGATWAYRKGTAEASWPPTAWQAVPFDDSGWASGALPLGYGEPGVNVDLTDMQGSYGSVFLRKPFVTLCPALVRELRLWAEHDDGFLLWINGEETARVNMPGQAGEWLPYDTLAASSVAKTEWSATLAGTAMPALLKGTNVAAIQLFNSSQASSDLWLDFQLSVVEGSPAPGDADADGLADPWEISHFGTVSVPAAAADADPDGDGVDNLGEYVAGTDPTNAAAFPWLGARAPAGQVRVAVPTVPAGGSGYEGLARFYRIEERSAAWSGTWHGVSGYTRITADGETVTYTNTSPSEDAWFRARVWLE